MIEQNVENRFRKDEKMVMANEMNIEKVKDLLVMLNKEMVSYRKQVGSIGKYDDVMKILAEMNSKFAAVEQDKAYTEDMVQKVHGIADQVNSKFDEFADALGAISELQSNVEHLSTNVPHQKHVVTKQELNKVLRVHHDTLKSTMHDYRQGMDKKGKEFEVHHLKHPQVRQVDVQFRNEILGKMDKLGRDVEGLKGYAKKNFHADELARIQHEIRQIEGHYARTLDSMEAGSHSREHLEENTVEAERRVQALRSKMIGQTADQGKKERLHRVLRKRQFRKASPREEHVSQVDIEIGGIKESALEHSPIHGQFGELRKNVMGKEILKDVVQDVALKKQQAAPDSSPVELDHVMSDDTVDKLNEMIQVIHGKMVKGDQAGAVSEYEKAMEFYVKLHNDDVENLERSYDALVDAYNKIMG